MAGGVAGQAGAQFSIVISGVTEYTTKVRNTLKPWGIMFHGETANWLK